ncbi:1-deoxy-D-xylulose-5-phosphate reductoisomerase [Saccharicrinis sp. FJH2]|uniref:1-deoxy-D-xylulose-5-phosphate reductoisomerase n=1 Tax=Saccharicrinis sp. FJH65 TaxID=3344659 RepID=UPI0035F42EBC
MEKTRKKLAILGSTGSIGTQTLDVIRGHSDKFEAYVLTAGNNADLLIKQALEFKPEVVVIGNKDKYPTVSEALSGLPIKVFAGEEAIAQVVEFGVVDMVVTAMVGYAGLKPTINAIKAGKNIALANKETLVVAGELIMGMAAENKIAILPVDSEHSALYQCMAGEWQNQVEKIILTASGGPFRTRNYDYLQNVTSKEALKHPNWDMGVKITIDSATMMNKGFEVIEAKWLFGLKHNQIEVIVHPQSIIHSLVEFTDGSLKAQMGLPDMKLPIQYALSYPKRLRSTFPRFNFLAYPELTFEQPDPEKFRCLELAYQAMYCGGNIPCIMNAANEVVVKAFLQDKIGFLEIAEIIEKTMEKTAHVKKPTYEDYVATDAEARKIAASMIK